MQSAVVMGAGPVGSAIALLLARRGVEVTVVDRDAAPPDDPLEAWSSWRRGVGQFRQGHWLHARASNEMRAHLPDVRQELTDLGGVELNMLHSFTPPGFLEPRDDDHRYDLVTARRPVIDLAFARVLDREPLVEVRRGTAVAGLVADATGNGTPPHVRGVRLADGDEVEADVTIDATGRRSRLPHLLEEVGARPLREEVHDTGFTYYSRFFADHTGDGPMPAYRAPLLAPYGSISVLSLPGDNDTWSVTVYTGADDHELRSLRQAHVHDRVVRAHPLHEHFTAGTPLGPVTAMVSELGKRRWLVDDDGPVAAGILPVGDAWASTNPSLGRGITFGLMHAVATADLVAEVDEPSDLTRVWQAVTDAESGAWYESTLAQDAGRLAEMEAERSGAPPPALDDAGRFSRALSVAAGRDPEVLRAALAMGACLGLPDDVLAADGLVDRIRAAAGDDEPVDLPRPTRQELIELVRTG